MRGDSSAEARRSFAARTPGPGGWKSLVTMWVLGNLFASPEKLQIAGPRLRREERRQKERARKRPLVSQENDPFDPELETDAIIPRSSPPPTGGSEKHTL